MNLLTFSGTSLIVLTLINPLAQAQSFPQYSVNNLTTVIEGDETDIYYPSNTSQSYPMVVLLTGALVKKGEYTNFAQELASYGLITAVSNHQQTFPAFGFDGQLPELSQITKTLAYLKQQDIDPTSPLFNLVDEERLGAVGHSHGAGAVLRSTESLCVVPYCSGSFKRPKELQAVVGYGMNRFNPFTMMFETTNNQIPVGFIQGSQDGIATPDEALNSYNLVKSHPKALITINGANHYSISNTNNPTGATPDPQFSTLSQIEGNELIAEWTAIFLLTHLINNSQGSNLIYGNGNADPRVSIISQNVSEPSNIIGLIAFCGLGLIGAYKQ